MFLSTANHGFGHNHFVNLRDNARYPVFSQHAVFNQATTGQRIVLPDYVNMIRVYVWGGGGAGGHGGGSPFNDTPSSPGRRSGGTGGNGGLVQADLPIIPGTVLFVRVGGGGNIPEGRASPLDTVTQGGGGGGYSSIELPNSYPTPEKYLIVAGGGGGGGVNPKQTSHPGTPTGNYTPGLPGGPAFNDAPGPLGFGGKAGTLIAGGLGGTVGPAYIDPIYPITGPVSANSGGFLRGGGGVGSPPLGGINGGGGGAGTTLPPTMPAPARNSNEGTGGGGGGWYGGGQGISEKFTIFGGQPGRSGEPGGGGGSSYYSPLSSNVTMANTSPEWSSHPIYTLYNVPDPDIGDGTLNYAKGGLYYPGPTGGDPRKGGSGLIVITY